MLLFRNANLPAHEIRDFRAQRYAIALGLLGNLDLRQEHDLIVIAILGERSHGDDMGNRPKDRSRRKTLRQGPLNRGRLARITRIDPVGVPARLDPFLHRDRYRLAGLGCGLLREQVDLHVMVRPRPSGHSTSPPQGGQNQRQDGRKLPMSHSNLLSNSLHVC